MSEARGGYRQSVSGLVGALLVTLGLIVVAFAFTLLQRRATDEAAPTIDYRAELAQARAQAPFEVLAPDAAPTGWRATSADWQGAGPEKSWHLGFLTSDDQYVGLEQGNAAAPGFIADHTTANVPAGAVDVNKQRWQTLTDGGDETALVLAADDVTTIVTGTARLEDLVAFAQSLTGD